MNIWNIIIQSTNIISSIKIDIKIDIINILYYSIIVVVISLPNREYTDVDYISPAPDTVNAMDSVSAMDAVRTLVALHFGKDILGVIWLYFTRNDFDIIVLLECLQMGRTLTLPLSHSDIDNLSKYRVEKLRRMFSQSMFPVDVAPRLYYVCRNWHNLHPGTSHSRYGWKHDCIHCIHCRDDDIMDYNLNNDYELDDLNYDFERTPVNKPKRTPVTVHPLLKKLSGSEMVWLYEQVNRI